MMKKLLICLISFNFFVAAFAQNDSSAVIIKDTVVSSDSPVNQMAVKNTATTEPVYTLKAVADVPIFLVGAGWSAYAFTKIYSKPSSSEASVLSLNKSKINFFDRWAVRPFSKSLDKVSYYPFYASTLLPLFFLADKKESKDFFKLSFLYLEAMSVTGFLYTGSVYFNNRYRPYVYDASTPLEQRTRGGGKNSFYAGHVALVATSTFFFAKVYSDYHPESKCKWVYYSVAGLATGTTAYLRYRGGQHFPTDILLGITQGTLTGLLVPQLHKKKIIKDDHLSILPYSSGKNLGLALNYQF